MKTGEFPAFTSNPFQFSPKQQWEEMDKTGMETGKNPSTEQCTARIRPSWFTGRATKIRNFRRKGNK
jgi:hypothetical protein